MRDGLWQQVAALVHGILQAHAPGCPVEKASYDDFYLDVTSLCHMDMGPADHHPPPQLHITHVGQWPEVKADMRNALLVGILPCFQMDLVGYTPRYSIHQAVRMCVQLH